MQIRKKGDGIKKNLLLSLCLYNSNLGTFWLKIEQFWPFEEISIFSNGGHLGYRTVLTGTILKGDHKLLSQSQPNFAEMILRWSPFKFVSVRSDLYPRWPPLLKIEISSNGQNCSIFEEISIFRNGGHLGYRTVLTGTILKGDHLRIISAKFG
jgi:hypothetical protein